MAYMVKQVQQLLPNGVRRTYYMRLAGMGDGPVTSPDQDPTTGEIQMPDDYVGKGSGPGSPAGGGFDSSSDQVVATVGPIITGVTGAVTSTVDWLKNALSSSPPVQPPAPGTPITTTITGTGTSGPNLLVLAALGIGGYAAYKHFKKKGRP